MDWPHTRGLGRELGASGVANAYILRVNTAHAWHFVQMMRIPMTRLTALRSLMLVGLIVVLAACNTVQGVGRDIESIGRDSEEAINE